MSRKSKWVRATAVSAVLLVLSTGAAFAQSAPVVSNVRAVQRGDGSRLVDIRYDLAHNAACTVWPVLSGDGGVSWSVPAMTLTGDLGPGVAPGTNRHIIWDAAADIPGVIGTYSARVYADDGSTLSNMVFVPAGTFPYQRNYAQQTFVGSFFIDKYEMTNQRYAEFLNDADPNGTYWNASIEITRSGTPPNIFYAVNPGRQNYPIRYVSALDAEAYAAWLSAREGHTHRLPTEQEWEKAAAWDPTISKHWLYGFQTDAGNPCDHGNYYLCGFGYCVGSPTEVGHYNGTNGTTNAKSFYGCYDMSGNVGEWTSSRIIRGGAWTPLWDNCFDTRTTWRGNIGPQTVRESRIGFRLVLAPN